MSRTTAVFSLLGLLCAFFTGPANADWTEVELRGWVDVAEVVLPIFGQTGEVGAGPVLNFGVGWRETDDLGGFKPLGIYVGGSFIVSDPFSFNWVQVQGGITHEELLSIGAGVWVGNRIREVEESVAMAVPGLDWKAKILFGFGAQADP